MFTQRKGRKFTNEQVQEMREMYYKDLHTLNHLAEVFRCSKSTIQKIVSFESYTDVKNPPSITSEMIIDRKPFREKYSKYVNARTYY